MTLPCRIALTLLLGIVPSSHAENLKPRGKDAPDLTTAKSAALEFIDASWSGDRKRVEKILIDDDDQREFLASIVGWNAAHRRLERAAIERFGDPGRKVTGFPDGSAKAVRDQMKVHQSGDTAKVFLKQAMHPLELRRIDGNWRVDLSAALRKPRVKDVSGQARTLVDVVDEITKKIKQGEYPSADAAAREYRKRRLAVARADNAKKKPK